MDTMQVFVERTTQEAQLSMRALSGHIFRPHSITLPWGATVAVVSVDLRDEEGADPEPSKGLRTP